MDIDFSKRAKEIAIEIADETAIENMPPLLYKAARAFRSIKYSMNNKLRLMPVELGKSATPSPGHLANLNTQLAMTENDMYVYANYLNAVRKEINEHYQFIVDDATLAERVKEKLSPDLDGKGLKTLISEIKDEDTID